MNWTGGRLRRHSKANANAVGKAQRQHFAKARLRLQNGRKQQLHSQPSNNDLDRRPREFNLEHRDHDIGPGGSCSFGIRSQNDNTTSHRGPRSVPIQTTSFDSRKRRKSTNPEYSSTVTINNLYPDGWEHSQPQGLHNPSYEVRSSRKSTNVEPKPLEDIKCRLLKSSDWMGLSAVRPLKIDFPPVKELQNVGKRRKITYEDKERQRGPYAHYEPQPSLNDGLRNARNWRRSPPADSRDVSIRIGDDFDQYRTFRAQSPQKQGLPKQKSSSEFAPPDTEAFQRLVESNYSRDVLKTSFKPRSRGSCSSECLIPLSEALDAENFDQIRSRSLSLSPVKMQSSPFRKPTISAQKLARQYASNQHAGDAHFTSNCREPPSTYPSSPPCMPDRKADSSLLGEEDNGNSTFSRLTENTCEEPAPSLPRVPRVGQASTASLSEFDEPNTNKRSISRTVRNSSLSLANETQCDSQHFTTQRSFTLERQAKTGVQSKLNEEAKRPLVDNDMFNEILSKTHRSREGKHFPPSRIVQLSNRAGRPTLPEPSSPLASQVEARPQPLQKALSSKGIRNQRSSSISWILQSERPPASSAANQPSTQSTDKQIPTLDIFSRQAKEHTGGLEHRQAGALFKAQKHPCTFSELGREDDEKWMRFIFGQDFNKVNGELRCGNAKDTKLPSVVLPTLSRKRTERNDDDTQLEELRWSSSLQDDSASPRTIRTSANTILHQPSKNLWQKQLEPSETDFLSQMSPMTGYLDERIGDISTYTNPARSKRSVLTAQKQEPARLGENHFASYPHSPNDERSVRGESTWLIEHHPLEPSQRSPSAWSSRYLSMPSLGKHSR